MKNLIPDKRILLFLLFALPVIFVALISFIVNTQSIYPGSKANEPVSTGASSSSVSARRPPQSYCLSPQLISSTGIIEVYQDPEKPLPGAASLKIYAVGPTSVQYISLVNPPFSAVSSPVTKIPASMIDKGALVRFTAIRADSETATLPQGDFEERMRLFARECQALVLE